MEAKQDQQSMDLLDSIYQSAGMAKDMLGRLIKKCEDANFRFAMATEFAEYQGIIDEAKQLIESAGGKDPEPGKKKSKSAAFGALRLNLAVDKTSSHMAEMIIQGSVIGVIEIKRKLKENPDAGQDTKTLAEKLMKTEQNNIASMLEHV